MAALATGACGPEAGEHEVTASSTQAIYGGVIDSEGGPNASVVALRIGDGTSFELCTGAVVAPNVVVTARHCLGESVRRGVSCDQNGRSGNGEQMGDDYPPAIVHVYAGAAPDLSARPIANGKAIYRPEGSVVCNADIGILVLDRPVALPALAVRLRGATDRGEALRAVGYGQNDRGIPVGTRLRRDGVSILAVGRTVSPFGTPLGSNELEVGQSICTGDSGGPAISARTGAIVGVVSRGNGCSDDYGHIYTLTAGFEPLFRAAFRYAGATLDEETAPDAPGPLPPGGPPDASQGGCSAAGASTPPATGIAAVALGALAFAVRQRRRRQP